MAAVSASVQAHAHFQIRILGSFALERDGAPVRVNDWPPQARALLRLLASAPEQRILRDDLIELLWPEVPPAAGGSNVRRVVHLLRQALGGGEPSPVLTEGGWVALNPAYAWDIDLQRFEAMLATAGDDPLLLERAAELYRGEPLVEDRYADWATPIRERGQWAWRRLCLRLAELHRARAMLQEAIGWLERALDLDPLDEEVVRQLLILLGQLGRRREALRYYRRFEERLRSELEVSPLPETVALVERLAAQGGQASSVPGAELPLTLIPSYSLPAIGTLVGREAELAEVLGALTQEGSTRPSLILLAGEAGMGKTRLLAEIAWRAREAGALTLAGGSYEQEGRLPYGPLHDALLDYVRARSEEALRQSYGDLFREFSRIVPELRERLQVGDEVWPGDAESRRLQLFVGAARILERMAADRPLLLLLDDLHWADDATLQLLHFLARNVAGSNLLVIGTLRPEEVGGESLLAQLLAEMHQSGWGRTIFLGGLGEPELGQMLSERLRQRCGDALVRELSERSAGNPFFALQTLRLLEEEGTLEEREDGWSLVSGAAIQVPREVRDTVARRLRRLRRETREMLTLGSVLGRGFPYPALEAMWEGEEAILFAAVEEAVEAHLLRETEQGYTFRHPILREVVYAGVGRPRRARLHGRAGLALETLYMRQLEEHAAELAHHFLEAGQVQAERAVRYLTLAGEAAARAFAWQDAGRCYRHLVELLDTAGQQTEAAAAREKLGAVLSTQARNDEALDALERAAEIYRAAQDGESEGRVVAQIGRVHCERRTLDEGIARVEPVLRRLEGQISGRTAASLFVSLSHLLRHAGRYVDALSAAQAAAELARAEQDTPLVAEIEIRRSNIMMHLGDIAGSAKVVEEAMGLAEACGALSLHVLAMHQAAEVYFMAGEPSKARLSYDRAVELAERLGDPAKMALVLCDSGLVLYDLGDWLEARSRFERALTLSRSLTSSPSAYPHLYLGMLQLAQGEREEGTANVERALAIAEAAGDTMAVQHGSWLLAMREIYGGRPDLAAERLEQVAHQCPTDDLNFAILLPVLACAHLELGRVDEAQREITQALALATGKGSEPVAMWALRVQGLVLAEQKRWRQAHQALERVAAYYRDHESPAGEAQTLETWGAIWLRQGHPDRAAERLREARALYHRLGAREAVERVEHASRALTAPR